MRSGQYGGDTTVDVDLPMGEPSHLRIRTLLKEHPVNLPDRLLALLAQPSTCYLATTMPDGSPQLTQTWVDTDGRHVLINSVAGFQKIRNIERDPRVAVTVSDPTNPTAYFTIRGRVLSVTPDGATEHIEKLAQRYLGRPYPWFGGRDQIRLLITIEAEKITGQGWRPETR